MTDDEKIPVAVVGAGNMGSNHIRVYDELPEAELVEVVETDAERAAEVKNEYDVEIVESVDELRKAEAATVAVPNRFHKRVSLQCIKKDINILVEKPLAEDVYEAQEIADTAEEEGVTLQVGHIERFNPAVEALRDILEEEEVIAFEAHRLGPFNEQLSEESVVFDLMIHDIDIIDSIADSEIVEINAVGSRTKSNELDYVFSQLKFENDLIASITASHVTHGKVRTLDITTPESYINLDYQKQDITIQRRGTEETTNLFNRRGYRNEEVTESPYIKRAEPLKRELRDFLSSVNGDKKPTVDGDDGVNTIKIGSKIVKEVKRD